MLWMSKFAGLESGKEILGLLKGHVWWVLSSPLLSSVENTSYYKQIHFRSFNF